MSTITNEIAKVYLGGLTKLLDEQDKKLHTFAFDRSTKNMQECLEINRQIEAYRKEIKEKVV